MGGIKGFLEGVAEAVEGFLVEGAPDDLQPDGEARGGGPAGDGEARKAVHVRRPGEAGEGGVDRRLVAFDGDLSLPDLGGRYRDARRQDHVDFPEHILELPARQEFPLLGVGVPVGPKLLTLEQSLEPLVVEPLWLGPQPLLVDGVGLGGEGQALGVQRLPGVRHLDLADLRAELPEDLDGLPHPRLDLPLDVLEKEARRDADDSTPDAAVEVAGEVFGGTVHGVEVLRVVAGQGGEEEGVVLDSAGEGADVVEGPGQGKHATFADAPEGRLHADHAAEGGGDADGTARVRAVGAVAEARGDGRTRPTRGAAGDPGEVVRVPRRPEVGAVPRRPVGELVGVRLAEKDGPGLAKLAGDGGVFVGDVVLEESGGHRGPDARGGDEVLYGDGYAVQRAAVPAGRDLRLRPARVLHRPPGRHRDKRVRLVELYTPEQRLRHLDRRDLPGPHGPREPRERPRKLRSTSQSLSLPVDTG